MKRRSFLGAIGATIASAPFIGAALAAAPAAPVAPKAAAPVVTHREDGSWIEIGDDFMRIFDAQGRLRVQLGRLPA